MLFLQEILGNLLSTLRMIVLAYYSINVYIIFAVLRQLVFLSENPVGLYMFRYIINIK